MYNIFDPKGDYNNLNCIEDYRKVINELASTFTNKSSVTEVGVVYKNKKFFHSTNHVCHAGLNRYNNDDSVDYKKDYPKYMPDGDQR